MTERARPDIRAMNAIQPYSIRGVFPVGYFPYWDGELWHNAHGQPRVYNEYKMKLMRGAERNYPSGSYAVEVRLYNGQLVRYIRKVQPK
jgi:hypothetical protein